MVEKVRIFQVILILNTVLLAIFVSGCSVTKVTIIYEPVDEPEIVEEAKVVEEHLEVEESIPEIIIVESDDAKQYLLDQVNKKR